MLGKVRQTGGATPYFGAADPSAFAKPTARRGGSRPTFGIRRRHELGSCLRRSRWGAVELGLLVQLQPQVVPHHPTLEVAGRYGEGHGILAWFQQGGVKLQGPLLRKSLIGIVADAVGGDQAGVVRAA